MEKKINHVHCIWIGPKKMRFSEEMMLRSVEFCYGIKPTLWVCNTDITNNINDAAVVKDIPKEYVDWMMKTEDPIAHKADFVRYMVLREYGGLCLDMDGICNRPILPGDEEIILGQCCDSRNPNAYNCAVMYSKGVGNTHINRMIDMYYRVVSRYRNNPPWGTTGPDLVTEYIRRHPDSGITVYDQQAFYKYSWHEWYRWFGPYTEDDLKTIQYIHLWGKFADGMLEVLDQEYVETFNNLYNVVSRRVLYNDAKYVPEDKNFSGGDVLSRLTGGKYRGIQSEELPSPETVPTTSGFQYSTSLKTAVTNMCSTERAVNMPTTDQVTTDQVTAAVNKGYVICNNQIYGDFVKACIDVSVIPLHTVVEIGTYEGCTFACFINIQNADKRVSDPVAVSIDNATYPYKRTAEEYKTMVMSNLRRAGCRTDHVNMIVDDSHSTSCEDALLKVLNGRKIDLLFIDGDHSYNGVKQDFETYSKYMSDHGVVGFHDIFSRGDDHMNIGVRQFWSEIRKNYPHSEFTDAITSGAYPSDWSGGVGLLYIHKNGD